MIPSDPPPAEPRLLSAPRKPWYTRPATWIVVVVLVVAGAWLWHARSGGDTTAPATGGADGKRAGYKGKGGGAGKRGGPMGANDVMPVGVATAKRSDLPIYLAGLGSVTPVATVTVKPRVDGQLVAIDYREGQIVRPGEVLAQIDPRPFQVVVEQAEGTLARDQALLANAKVDYERYKKLVEQDSIATQQLDTQKSLVSQLEGTVKGDRGNFDSAKLQLSYTKITAPVGGRIGLRQVDVGNMVHASDTNGIVVITQLQPIDVVFSVPEGNVQRIMKRLVAGNTLPVDAWNRDNSTKLADGNLLTVDNQIDVATGTVKLKGRFPNIGYELFPNQFVNARLALDVLKNVVVVPPNAVQRGAQGFYVYVANAEQHGFGAHHQAGRRARRPAGDRRRAEAGRGRRRRRHRQAARRREDRAGRARRRGDPGAGRGRERQGRSVAGERRDAGRRHDARRRRGAGTRRPGHAGGTPEALGSDRQADRRRRIRRGHQEAARGPAQAEDARAAPAATGRRRGRQRGTAPVTMSSTRPRVVA